MDLAAMAKAIGALSAKERDALLLLLSESGRERGAESFHVGESISGGEHGRKAEE